jgi:hypothetical protein
MATAETFEIGTDLSITSVIEEPLAVPESIAELTGIDRIMEMMADPDANVADISRMIAQAMGAIMQQMTASDPLRRGAMTQRELNEQIKAFRELQRTLVESEQLSKKDSLNLDGPKFAFVFKQIVGFFQQALKESGVEESLQKNVMLQFGDLVRTNNENLRKEINRL